VTDRSISPPSSVRRRWQWWWLAVFVVALVLLHAPLLRSCTQLVSVQERLPPHVDAVLIYEGDDRHAAAAQWIKSGFAKTILLPRRLAERNVAFGIIPPRDLFDRSQLLALQIKDESIHYLDGEGPLGEWRFLRLLGTWLNNHPGSQAVVLCKKFDSRRVRHAIGRVLPVTDSQRVHVKGLPSLDYDDRYWWRSRRGAVDMFDSLLAQAYARCVGEDQDEPISWDVDAFEKGLQHR
jgi:hypothetical protein